MSKKKKNLDGVVYSTDPEYKFKETEEEVIVTPLPGFQVLRVGIERKGRGGKEVTLIRGFVGSESDKTSICNMIKKKCGVGGNVDGEDILIQGDKRDQIVNILIKEGFTNTKKSGS